MPRIFDYASRALRCETVFPLLADRSPKGTEVQPDDVWPTVGSVMDGRCPQHSLKPENGVRPYDNELVDPVYEWLVENCAGRWMWFERETNHGHSVSTDVWIDDPAERLRFEERWSSIFPVSPKALEDDERAREAEQAPSGPVPG